MPGFSLGNRAPRLASGGRAAVRTGAVTTRCVAAIDPSSEVLAQVHACVQTGNFFGVAVEGQRRPPPKLADAPLAALAPARMIHFRVHVGVEAVLVRRG